VGQHHAFEGSDSPTGHPCRLRCEKRGCQLVVHVPRGIGHLRREGFARGIALAAQPSRRGLAAALPAAEHDARQVGVAGVALAAGLSSRLLFLLLAQCLFSAFSLDPARIERALRRFAFRAACFGVKGMVSAIAAQSRRRQFDDAFHAFQQFAIMTYDQ